MTGVPKFVAKLIIMHVILCVFRTRGHHEWCHCSTAENRFGSFLGEMSWAVHNVSVDSHAYGSVRHYLHLHRVHRSPPVDQQNSSTTVDTDQPEDPTVGTKRARMMPGSKIVLPSSVAEEYSAKALVSTISRIVNPRSKFRLYFVLATELLDYLQIWRVRLAKIYIWIVQAGGHKMYYLLLL